MKKIKEADWVSLRLLYLLSVNDPTIWKFDEVKRVQRYFMRKYGADFDIADPFSLLVKEHAKLGTFYDKPDIKICRELDNAVYYKEKDDGTDFVQWRLYE